MVTVGPDGQRGDDGMTDVCQAWGVASDAVVGVMGGSFNPAHDGHLHISGLACTRLRLDRMVWLVSPQNPLKSATDMASFQNRFQATDKTARADDRIVVSDLEARLGTRHTADTLVQLTSLAPGLHIVWIMGADNLAQIDRWMSWTTIFETVPIAVFARPPYSDGVMTCKAADTFADSRLDETRGARLALQPPPAWIYFDTPLNSESATRIRTGREAE